MPVSQRHPALQGLAQDHLQILRQVEAIRAFEAAESHPPALQALAQAYLDLWIQMGCAHLWEEEDVLLPALARRRVLDEDEAVQQMLADHAWLHRATAEIHRRLASDEAVVGLLKAVGNRLEAHVRLEERVIFDCVEAVLEPEELDRLARRAAAFRAEWRQGEGVQLPLSEVEAAS